MDSPDLEVSAADLHADGGTSSRKFLLALLSMGLIVVCGILAGWLSGLAGNLGTVVGGILGAFGLYAGSNVSTKFAAASISKEQVRAAGKGPAA